jgi:Protein of unknown function (DUF3347)
MKKVLAVLGILVLLFAAFIWYFYFGGKRRVNSGPKPVPIAVSKHSDVFNKSVGEVLNEYYNLAEAFVNWDTNSINKYGNAIKTALDNLKLEELKADTTGIYESALDPVANAKTEVENILGNSSIDAKRTSLNALSENLRLLLIVVKYDREKMYWQECPMAFGEEKPGNWLSKTIAVRNPYLGTQHPEYKDQMLHCGGPKDTINFIPVDTIKAN